MITGGYVFIHHVPVAPADAIVVQGYVVLDLAKIALRHVETDINPVIMDVVLKILLVLSGMPVEVHVVQTR
jgi:hypothetical protein